MGGIDPLVDFLRTTHQSPDLNTSFKMYPQASCSGNLFPSSFQPPPYFTVKLQPINRNRIRPR